MITLDETKAKLNLYAKIVHDEGVVFEKKYATETQAQAFVDGFNATKDALDLDDDSHFACVDDKPSEDE